MATDAAKPEHYLNEKLIWRIDFLGGPHWADSHEADGAVGQCPTTKGRDCSPRGIAVWVVVRRAS